MKVYTIIFKSVWTSYIYIIHTLERLLQLTLMMEIAAYNPIAVAIQVIVVFSSF